MYRSARHIPSAIPTVRVRNFSVQLFVAFYTYEYQYTYIYIFIIFLYTALFLSFFLHFRTSLFVYLCFLFVKFSIHVFF